MEPSKANDILHQFVLTNLDEMTESDGIIHLSGETHHDFSDGEKYRILNIVKKAWGTLIDYYGPRVPKEATTLFGKVRTQYQKLESYQPHYKLPFFERLRSLLLNITTLPLGKIEESKEEIWDYLCIGDEELKLTAYNIHYIDRLYSGLKNEKSEGERKLFLTHIFQAYGLSLGEMDLPSLETFWKRCLYTNFFIEKLLTHTPLVQNKLAHVDTFLWNKLVDCSPESWPHAIDYYNATQGMLPKSREFCWDSYMDQLKMVPSPLQEKCAAVIAEVSNLYNFKDPKQICELFKSPDLSELKILEFCEIIKILRQLDSSESNISNVLSLAIKRPDLVNLEFVKILTQIKNPDVLLWSLHFLPLLVTIDDLPKFVSELNRISAIKIPHKTGADILFQTFYGRVQANPAFENTCKLLTRRWETEDSESRDKLRLLSSVIELKEEGETILTELDKIAMFTTTPLHDLVLILLVSKGIPHDRIGETYRAATFLTNNRHLFTSILPLLPYVELSERSIKTLCHLPPDLLEDTLSLLIFTPPRAHRAMLFQNHHKKEDLLKLSPERLTSDHFPQFEKLLKSTDQKLVTFVSEFLLNFIHQEKINPDSEMGLLIMERYSITHENLGKYNPFVVHSRFPALREETIAVSLPYRTVSGEDVRLDLAQITDVADKILLKWNYQDLRTALGKPLVSSGEIRAWFDTLKTRDLTLLNKTLRERGLGSLAHLEKTLCEDRDSLRWQAIGAPLDKVPDTTVQFNACMSYYLSHALPPLPESGQILSEGEIALLEFAGTFYACTTGRNEQLRIRYEEIERLLPPQLQDVNRSEIDFFTQYIHHIIRNAIQAFIDGDLSETVRLAGLSDTHVSQYVTNLIGRRLGLLTSEVIFDPHLAVVRRELIDKSSSELTQAVIDHFPLNMLVKMVQKKLCEDLARGDPLSRTLERAIGPIIQKGPQMGWYYQECIDREPPNPDVDRISELCALEALSATHFFALRDTPDESVPFLSLGVDKTGHIIRDRPADGGAGSAF